jgi:hypothetical protein
MSFRKGESGNQSTQFRPGQSGNPGGRQKGFAKAIQAKCGDDYERIVEGLYAIAFGSPKQVKEVFGPRFEVTPKMRLTALLELRNSGPGRPRQVDDVEAPPDVPLFAPGFDVAVVPPGYPGASTPTRAITSQSPADASQDQESELQ